MVSKTGFPYPSLIVFLWLYLCLLKLIWKINILCLDQLVIDDLYYHNDKPIVTTTLESVLDLTTFILSHILCVTILYFRHTCFVTQSMSVYTSECTELVYWMERHGVKKLDIILIFLPWREYHDHTYNLPFFINFMNFPPNCISFGSHVHSKIDLFNSEFQNDGSFFVTVLINFLGPYNSSFKVKPQEIVNWLSRSRGWNWIS